MHVFHKTFKVLFLHAESNLVLEPWASKTARHYFEGLDMQRNE